MPFSRSTTHAARIVRTGSLAALVTGLAGCAMTSEDMSSVTTPAPATATATATAPAAETSPVRPPVVTALAYPRTEAGSTVDVAHGLSIADPYRWLEDDVRVNPKVAAWVEQQNRVTDAYLANLPGRQAFKERMTELYDYERYGIPRKAGGRYFYSRNDGLQPQSVLYVRDTLAGAGRVLIDPNLWSKDGATALAEWEPSEDGRHLAYGIQDGGSDWRTIRVLDVVTGRVLDDKIEWAKFNNIDWDASGEGFYYSRFPTPKGGAEFQSLNENHQVFYHRLGTPQSADRLIHSTPANPKRNHVAQVTDDGKYLLVTTSEGTDDRYALTLYPLTGPGRAGKPVVLAAGLDHSWGLVANVGTRFWFTTNKDAPRGRVVAMDIARPDRLTEIVPQTAGTLEGASLVGDRIVLSYLDDVKSRIVMVKPDGSPAGSVALPGIGSAAGFGGKAGDGETFYAFSSFATPATIYRYDATTGATSVFAQPKLAFNPDDYQVEQRFYQSKDGTRIPMFIVMKKGMDRTGGSPTLLYGYGGFNIALPPSYAPTRLAWLDKGGVLAVANLRGGGEYGKAWHDAGRLANKQNVFDDFIAAGEYLIREGITGRRQLAIEGRSNGGLLVGAVVNQRPDLFAAALPGVGVMDMTRFDRFTAGRYWVDDYGYPDRPDDLRRLYAYSPYHNVKGGAGRDYPAVMVTTADTDDRVVPGHSFKYTAALQAADLGPAPRLIRIETRAGHGSGKPTDKIIAEFADMYAFIAHHTGLKVE